MAHAIADFLTRRRLILLALAFIMTAAAYPAALRLQLNRTIESLYASDDPRLQAYLESKRLFGGDEFVIVAWKAPRLIERDGTLNPEAAADIAAFSDQLSRVGGIRFASTQDIARVLRNAQAFTDDLIASLPGRFERVIAGRIARAQQGRMEREAIAFSRGVLVGADDRSTAIMLRLEPEETTQIPRAETFRRLREIAATHDPPAYLAGEPLMIFDAFQYVEEDGRTLFLVSLALLSTVLLLLFRTFRWVILPLAVTIAAVIWTRALLAILGLELSMVSSMLNSLITIIAVATSAHVAVRYRELKRRVSRSEAVRQTIAELGGAIFWTTATTAAGFLSLVISDIMPIRSFGLMTALGAVMVLLASAMILPGGGTVAGKWGRKPDPETPPQDSQLLRGLGGLTAFARQRGLPVTLMAFALAVIAALGLTRLELETVFSKNFRADSPIVIALNFIEERLGGAGTWEVNFNTPPELTEEYLERVRALSAELKQAEIDGKPVLTKVVAITDGLDTLPNVARKDTLTEDLETFSTLQPEFVPSLYAPQAKRMRILLRSYERQPSSAKAEQIEAVTEIARRHFPEAKATGLFVLLTYLIDSLMRDQVLSFSIAGATIAVMMLIAYRRVSWTVAAMVPNVLPILILFGGMGWLDVPVNIGTAMIASVSIGLTIDSSIHYLIGYRAARAAGQSVDEALKQTGRRVGSAIVCATLALSAGFSVLALSHFIPLVYFGILVSLAMLGGLLGNLLLLPAFLSWIDRPRKPRESAAEPVSPAAEAT